MQQDVDEVCQKAVLRTHGTAGAASASRTMDVCLLKLGFWGQQPCECGHQTEAPKLCSGPVGTRCTLPRKPRCDVLSIIWNRRFTAGVPRRDVAGPQLVMASVCQKVPAAGVSCRFIPPGPVRWNRRGRSNAIKDSKKEQGLPTIYTRFSSLVFTSCVSPQSLTASSEHKDFSLVLSSHLSTVPHIALDLEHHQHLPPTQGKEATTSTQHLVRARL